MKVNLELNKAYQVVIKIKLFQTGPIGIYFDLFKIKPNLYVE